VQKYIYTYAPSLLHRGKELKRINITLPDELEERFRLEVAKRKGMRKGNLGKAVEEALVLWMEED